MSGVEYINTVYLPQRSTASPLTGSKAQNDGLARAENPDQYVTL
jgi:hypothetical protein